MRKYIYQSILQKLRVCAFMVCLVMTFAAIMPATHVKAISTAQRRLMQSGIHYFNVDPDCGDGSTPTEPTTANSPSGNLTYTAAGNIPPEGKEVGATLFGGHFVGGAWKPTNDVQNPSGKHNGNDDNGTGNSPLGIVGRTGYAELSIRSGSLDFSALGKLPEQTKLEITYNGKSIIAEKLDVGAGGGSINGKPRAIDIWWETARLLGMTDSSVVKVRVVDPSTPTTPLNGQPSGAPVATPASITGGGASPITPTSNAAPTDTPTCCAATGDTTTSTSTAPISGIDNAEKIYKYLVVNQRLTREQAGGILGNIMGESGFNPALQERGNGIGYGLIQWSFSRRTELEAAARAKGVPVSDLFFQLDYMVKESMGRASKTYPGTKEWDGLKRQTTVRAATDYWQTNSERPKTPQVDRRTQYANDTLAALEKRGVIAAAAAEAAAAGPVATPAGTTGSTDASGGGTGCADTASGGNPLAKVDIIKKISFSESRTIKPTAIVLHWWGGKGGIDSLISTLQSRGLSVQIGTTVDGKVYQLTPELNSYAPHAKCANSWAIGNEIEGGATFGKDPLGSGQIVALDLANNQVQFESVVSVTAQLMAKYNIPLDGPLAKDGSAGIGVHSHKEVDVNCVGRNGKNDVDDVYLKRVKDAIRKRSTATNGGTPGSPPSVTPAPGGAPVCNSNIQLPANGPGSSCDGLNNQYTPAQLKIIQNLRNSSKEPPLNQIVPLRNTRIHSSIAGKADAMINAATAAGLSLEPVVAFRSFDGQVYERKLFCGNSFDDIYVKKSGSCKPPVALPGQSTHQKGLAIDFGFNGVTNDYGYANTAEFRWLQANAAKYGFKPLPSEPWHWSTDGT